MACVRRAQKNRLSDQRRSPGPSGGVDAADEQGRQLCKECSVRLWHVIVNHLVADLVQALGHTHAPVERDFTGVKSAAHAQPAANGSTIGLHSKTGRKEFMAWAMVLML